MKINLVGSSLIAALLVSLTSLAHAQSSFGVGNIACSRYSKAARSNDMLYHEASNWLLGYVSGRTAAMQTADGKPIALSQQDALKSAADYCVAHPDATLAVAVGEWFASAAPPQRVEETTDRRWLLDLNKSSGYSPLINRR